MSGRSEPPFSTASASRHPSGDVSPPRPRTWCGAELRRASGPARRREPGVHGLRRVENQGGLEAGIRAETLRLSADLSPEALLGEVRRANADPEVHGILIQLPLPAGHTASKILDAVDPLKDVDGFHPENVGLLHQGRPRFVPCTPAGIMELLDAYSIPLAGRRAAVLGRSDIVGKPIAALLTARDATVTVCHSKTKDAAAICREADVSSRRSADPAPSRPNS